MSNIIGCIVEISSLISTRIRFPRMLHVTGQEGSKILGHFIYYKFIYCMLYSLLFTWSNKHNSLLAQLSASVYKLVGCNL